MREAAISDLAAGLELMAAHAEFEYSRFDPDGKHERLAKFLFCPDRAAICLVVTVGSRVVDYSTLSEEFSTWSAAHDLHMAEVKRIAGQSGVDQIQWQTPAWNHDAAHFYRRHKARAQHKLRFTLEPSLDDGAEADPVSAIDVLDAFTHAWNNTTSTDRDQTDLLNSLDSVGRLTQTLSCAARMPCLCESCQ